MCELPLKPNGTLPGSDQRHWPAWLALGFDHRPGRTRMQQMQFHGPLRVQRPFYPEGELCHIYLLHPPGGLVSGDDLQIQVDCQPNAQVLLTTPSAGKIYRADSQGVVQRQHVDIRVEAASCEWLPMETIVFDGAHGELETRINLYGNARYVGLDVFCLGRPNSEQPFELGSIEQRLSVYHNDKPLMLERQRLCNQDPLIAARAGFNNNLVSGTLVCFGLDDPETVIRQLRSSWSDEEAQVLSATIRINLLVVRYLGHCSEQAQRQLRKSWALLRPQLLHREPCAPRIWNT